MNETSVTETSVTSVTEGETSMSETTVTKSETSMSAVTAVSETAVAQDDRCSGDDHWGSVLHGCGVAGRSWGKNGRAVSDASVTITVTQAVASMSQTVTSVAKGNAPVTPPDSTMNMVTYWNCWHSRLVNQNRGRILWHDTGFVGLHVGAEAQAVGNVCDHTLAAVLVVKSVSALDDAV